MLAGVDYVIMGAGIPVKIPAILDALSQHQECEFPIDVAGLDDTMATKFSPDAFWKAAGGQPVTTHIKRPAFLPIVSSVVLAQSLLKKAEGAGPNRGIDGFVLELPTAGGHNAPPRGFRYDPVAKSHAVDLNDQGEPMYGPKDDVDLEKFQKVTRGLPFWLAGSYARPDKLCGILELGGAGVQAGTLFALAQESGMDDVVRQRILCAIAEKDLTVYTDPVASPTGYPFKVLELPGTLAEDATYQARPRACNLGYLRTAFFNPETKKIGYRCPAEPVKDWVKKGGPIEATVGRKCLCNALCANIGSPQVQMVRNHETGSKEPYVENILVTIGDDVNLVRRLMQQDKATGKWSYSAADVVEYLRQAWDKASATSDLVDDAELQEISRTVASQAAHDVTDYIVASSTAERAAVGEHEPHVEYLMNSIQETIEKGKKTLSKAQD